MKILYGMQSAYAQSNNNGKANWIAQELFADVIPDELIAEIFNEK